MTTGATTGTAPTALPATPYPRTSRYYGVPVAVHTEPDGRQVTHLRPRLLPRPAGPTPPAGHTVSAGERLDLLAYAYLGSADQWWRIADANPVVDPRELTATPGRRIAIPLPGTVPGTAGVAHA